MKKILATVLTIAMLLTVGSTLIGCGGAKAEENTRMTLDLNPQVEFMLDKNNKVVSVTGLNADGDLLVAGEAFVGKTAEEATELFIEISTDMGYLVKGSVSADENGIEISISGNEAAANALYEKVSSKAEAVFSEANITAAVTKVEAMQLEALKALVTKANPELTAEAVAAMTEAELYAELAAARKDAQALATEKLRQAYQSMKAYDISFAEHEATVAVIAKMDAAYQSFLTGYQSLLDNYSAAIAAVEQARYDYLVSPESDYQQALMELLDKKAELVAKKNEVAQMEDGMDKNLAMMDLQAKQTAFTLAETGLTTAGTMADTAISTLVTTMRSVETQLIAAKEQFPTEIATQLSAKATEIETAVNQAKDDAFTKFETEYAADIEATVNQLIAKKQAMKEANATDAQ